MNSRIDKKRGRMKLFVPVIILAVTLLIAGGFYLKSSMKEETAASKSAKIKEKSPEKIKEEPKQEPKPEINSEVKREPVKETTLKISAAGDFTLGSDESFNYSSSFIKAASDNGLPYFVKGMDNIFLNDDFTTVNLETTLTNATNKAVKKFRFGADHSRSLSLGQ